MKKKFKYPLASSSWDEKEISAIKKVINNNKFTLGEYVKKAEQKFAKMHKKLFCVMTNSGSSANLLMIASLFYKKNRPLKTNDEVIVPALGWSTSYFPLSQYGLKLKFIDINLDTLNYDLNQLKASISKNTKAILAVNVLGNPNNFKEIKKIINNKDIYLIEDNCESMYSEFEGKKTGTFGIMGSFSSYFSHHISTMEGGYILTDDEELYHILLSLRSHGWTRHLPKYNKVTGKKSENSFYESFKFVLPGYNLRPIEFNGAIALEQFKKLDKFIKERKKNAEVFIDIMSNQKLIKIQSEIGKSSWFGFSMVTSDKNRLSRNKLLKILQLLGFETRPIISGNFTKNPVMKYINCANNQSSLNNTDYVDKNGLFIGNHHFDCSRQLKNLKLIKNYL